LPLRRIGLHILFFTVDAVHPTFVFKKGAAALFSIISHKNNLGASCSSLPPGLYPRGLTLEQAATLVGLSKSGYNKHKRMGDYPGPTLPGKRYDRSLLEAAMDRLSGIQKDDHGSTPLEKWRAKRACSAAGN
jgi:hypothetical protein